MKKLHAYNGFTSIELLVAITLSFILISVIYGAYHFTFRYPRLWRYKTSLENTALTGMSAFGRDLLLCESVNSPDETQFILSGGGSPGPVYTIEAGHLVRNGFLITGEEERLTNLDCTILHRENRGFGTLFQENGTVPETDKRPLYHYEMTFAQGPYHLTLFSAVWPRTMNPVNEVDPFVRPD
ncbi:hypothetical protein JW948_12120 [bacterium]|nr:hypothetical protein [bacterium]